MPPDFHSQVKTLVGQFKNASQTLKKNTSLAPSDPDVASYDKITGQDMNEIALKFGLTSAINLVEDMEARRMGVKKRASR